MRREERPMRTIQRPRVVSREDWLDARKALQVKEKELTRLRDQLAAERRALPWVKVEKTYVFDGPRGRVTLADLFDGRSQLFVKHFMMGPGQAGQCVGCSLEVDHIGPLLVHLQNHDVSYAAVARAPIEEIEAVRAFYNYEYVNPGLEDRSGDSVFYKDGAGQIFHTYSTFGRGGEEFLGIYRYLDATPRGRGEDGPYHTLADWVRPRTMYGQGGLVEVTGRYHRPECACAVHESADRKEPS
jgi:predicted dithiol-disulfide oxidoreductase (DUF899 family)